jgi:hypothetical protein
MLVLWYRNINVRQNRNDFALKQKYWTTNMAFARNHSETRCSRASNVGYSNHGKLVCACVVFIFAAHRCRTHWPTVLESGWLQLQLEVWIRSEFNAASLSYTVIIFLSTLLTLSLIRINCRYLFSATCLTRLKWNVTLHSNNGLLRPYTV